MSEENGIVRAVCDCLTAHDIPARPAWSGEERARVTAPVVCVGIRGYAAAPGGFENYLGERYDEESACWREYYGKRVELKLSLDLWAGERRTGGELQRLLERLVQALTLSPPAGLQVGEITGGETAWDEKNRCLRREVSADCTAWLRAEAEESGAFTDFELRGGWNI